MDTDTKNYLKHEGINIDIFKIIKLIEENEYKKVLSIINKTPALVKKKYKIDDPDDQECLLMSAINFGSAECASIFIKNGANVDLVINDIVHDRTSLLHLALKLGEFKIARLLLENGAKIWEGDYSVDFIRYRHADEFLSDGFLSEIGYKKLVENFKLGINPELANLNVIYQESVANIKLITTNSDLKIHLSRLAKKYKNVSFAVAWASANTEIFKELVENRTHIRRAVIGTHFYQTHPDVLDAFVGSNEVRFILQPSGVFHPKIYVFWNEKHWEVLIGSANLTAGALSKNSEVMALISDSDETKYSLKEDMISLIDGYWEKAHTVSKATAVSYRALWLTHQPALMRLSGQYGQTVMGKVPTNSVVMSMTWAQFFQKVQQDPYHGFQLRCDLLTLARTAFQQTSHFCEMELGLRKTIGGLPTEYHEHWGWFGSMGGAGYYHQAVNNNNTFLSEALDEIPLDGPVYRAHYDAYLKKFVQAFPNGRHGVATASRLLALKRPDYFVCLDARNKTELCNDFGIRPAGMNYVRYWEEIIEPITRSVWWNEPRPIGVGIVGAVWDGRAAMLDAIFYAP